MLKDLSYPWMRVRCRLAAKMTGRRCRGWRRLQTNKKMAYAGCRARAHAHSSLHPPTPPAHPVRHAQQGHPQPHQRPDGGRLDRPGRALAARHAHVRLSVEDPGATTQAGSRPLPLSPALKTRPATPRRALFTLARTAVAAAAKAGAAAAAAFARCPRLCYGGCMLGLRWGKKKKLEFRRRERGERLCPCGLRSGGAIII